MPQAEAWTVGRLLQWTTGFLKDRGAENARLDAEVLLAQARHCQRIELYTAFEEVVAEDVRAEFRELVRRRAEGTPVAYLVGRREFYSLSFRVSPDVLIPRPETEFLVIALLDLVKRRSSEAAAAEIADVGAGSGILAICAAKHLSTCRLLAIDISPAALAVAAANAADHLVADRIEFVVSDLFAAVPSDRCFDYIVSNPPYITTAEMEQLPKTVREFEPEQALHGGTDGLQVISRLIPQAAERLKPGGAVLIEVSPTIEPAAIRLLTNQPGLTMEPTIRDLAGHPRVIRATRSS